MAKTRYTFRFSKKTKEQLEKCVDIKRKEHPWWDQTKVLEWLIDLCARGKVKVKR